MKRKIVILGSALVFLILNSSVSASYAATLTWHDKPGLAARVKGPRCVYNGKLYMQGIPEYGILSWDGSQISIGAKVAGSLATAIPFFWPLVNDGNVGIAAQVYISSGIGIIDFIGSGTNDISIGGAFNGLLSLRYKIEIDGTDSPDTFKWSDDGGETWDATLVGITKAAQTLNNGITVTFATETGHTIGDSWTFLASESRLEVTSNPDTTDFTDVTPVGFSQFKEAYQRNLIDCGIISDWNGGKRILLWFEYATANYASQAWYSEDNGFTWNKLFNAATGIRHFHGGIFVSGIGAKDGRLYIFTGDTGAQASILICDDVADLLANPSTWFGSTHWALGSDDRDDWSPNSDYVLGRNNQKWRTVDMVDDGEYGYWMTDALLSNRVAAYRVKHSTKIVETLATWPDIIGCGWIGLCTSSGQVLFTTKVYPSGTGFYSGEDEFIHLYSFTQGQVTELTRWRHAGYNPFVSPVINPDKNDQAYFKSFVEYDGNLYVESDAIEGLNLDLLGSEIRAPITKVGEIDKTYLDNPPGLIANPVNDYDFSIWNGNEYASWGLSGGTWSQDSNVVEPGFVYSAKCVVASGTPYCYQRHSDNAFLNQLKGYFCILIAKIRVASGAAAGFLPRLRVIIYQGASSKNILQPFYINNENSATAYADDKWHEFWVPFFVPSTVTEIKLYLYANAATGKTGTVYFSNIRVQRGSQPLLRGGQPLLMPADINKDWGVDFVDYAIFAKAWLSTTGSTGWDPNCDISIPADGVINNADLAVLVEYWLWGK